MHAFFARLFPRRARALAVAFALASGAAAAFAAVAVAEIPTGQPIDGIRCDSMEGSVFHIHQHVAIFDHGTPVAIPDSVGRPALGNCLYWIHTHTPDGLVHVEAPTFRSFTLGQFFDVWGEPFTAKRVASASLKKGERVTVWLNGNRYAGDPRKIELDQHTDVTIDVGPPAKKPQLFTDWNGQ